MENFIFLLSESWSTASAGQFFTILGNVVNGAYEYSGAVVEYVPEIEEAARGPMEALFWAMFRFFAATVFVAWLAWFATKKLAGARKAGGVGKNLSVIEAVNLGGHAIVQLVKAGDKFLVVGVTKERVTVLTELDAEQISEPEAVELKTMETPFGKVLSRFIQPKETEAQRDEDKNEE